MHKVVILRGIPGSGKSTKARELAATAIQANFSSEICSTDDFFIDAVDGLYKFDKTKLYTNHTRNFHRFLSCIHNKINLIIIDNTNINRSDYSHYQKAAELNGYDVEVMVINPNLSLEEVFQRQRHSVPFETIRRMHNSLLASLDGGAQI